MSKIAMSREEKKWQAESDARTLMEADVIKKDKPRLAAALVAAKKISEEKSEEARSIKAVLRRYKTQIKGRK